MIILVLATLIACALAFAAIPLSVGAMVRWLVWRLSR